MTSSKEEVLELGIYLYASTIDDIEEAGKAGLDRNHATKKAAQIMTAYTAIASAALGIGDAGSEKLVDEIVDYYEKRVALLTPANMQ